MLASLNSQHSLRSAAGLKAFKSQHNLLGNCNPCLENCLGLLAIDTPPHVLTLLSLGVQRSLALPLCGTGACHTSYRKSDRFQECSLGLSKHYWHGFLSFFLIEYPGC